MVLYYMLFLCAPPIIPWYMLNFLSLHLKLIFVIMFQLDFVPWLYDYLQWWNGSDTFVVVIAFLFVPPWRWPRKWQNHVGGYLVIKYIKILLCICTYLLVVFILWIYVAFWLCTIIYLDFSSFTCKPATWLASYRVHIVPLSDDIILFQFCVLSPNCDVIQYHAKCLCECGDKWIIHSPCEVGKRENECETVYTLCQYRHHCVLIPV